MRIKVIPVGILFTALFCASPVASSLSDDVEKGLEAGDAMAFECLSGDREIECLIKKGFTCASLGDPSRNNFSCYVPVNDGCFRKRFRLRPDGWSSSDSWLPEICDGDFEPTLGPGVRWRYDNANAPDELIFQLLTHRVFIETLDYIEDLDALTDEPHHAGYRFVEAGLTGRMASSDVVRYFAEQYLIIEKEVDELSRKLLCNGKEPRYQGAENLVIFNQLDDVKLNVYQRHLFLARADLQASGLFNLDTALSEYPGSFSSISFEHVVSDDDYAEKLLQAASRLCTEPSGHSISVTQSPVDDQIQIVK